MNVMSWTELDTLQRDQVELAVRRFTEEWNRTTPPVLVYFIASVVPQLRGRVLVELIKLDQKFRWRSVIPRTLESYLEEWPELVPDREVVQELLEAECMARATFANIPPAAELGGRFPDICGRLDLAALEADAGKLRAAESYAGQGRFFLVRKLGAGGMGLVYEVLDRQRQARVALKTLTQVQPEALYRFKHEFRSLAEIVHPNLVPLYELISDGRQWFFTMELIDGLDFLSYLRPGRVAAQQDDGTSLPDESLPGLADPLTKTQVEESFHNTAVHPVAPRGVGPEAVAERRVSIGDLAGYDKLGAALQQLAQGICALHEAGKLHRDIKPSNVLVTAEGQVVLLDFGLVTELRTDLVSKAIQWSSASSSDSLSTDRVIAGTAAYMAPEQAAGQPLTEASDWYSVGVMLYQVLTGRLPFSGSAWEVLQQKQLYDPPPPSSLLPELPEQLNCLCMALLDRDPARRPSGAELLAQGNGQGSARAGLGGAEAGRAELLPFVGRQRHLAVLSEAFQEAVSGRAAVVRVDGRSGTGKSTLVQRFLSEVAHRDSRTVVLSGRCYEQESVPYKALDNLIDSLTRHLLHQTPGQLAALIPPDVQALARVFPVLRRVDAVTAAPAWVAEIPDPQELRRRAFGALRQLLARLAAQQPLVLCIDDLQWGDVDSAALLDELLRPPDPPPLLLLACFRTEDSQASPFLRAFIQSSPSVAEAVHQRHLDVDALTAEESRELALALLGSRTSEAVVWAEAVARESGGNPYFVSELVRKLQSGRAWSTPAENTHITLDTVLGERIGRLPEDCRRLLEMVAVAGRPLMQQVARRAAGLTGTERRAVAVLRAGHLVRTTGPGDQHEIESYHDRIRETVLGLLSPATMQDRHRRLALALEASNQADPEALAVHFVGANEPQRAGQYYAAAAAQAAGALAFDRAAALYRLALDLLPAAEAAGQALPTRLGDALANAGRGAEAAEVYRRAAAGATAAEQLELERRAAMQLLISGHVDQGLAAIRRVLDRVGLKLPSTPFRALASLALRRTQLRLRGLHFNWRDTSQLSAEQLSHIDICWSVAVGLSIVDTIRGADFQTRNLLLSLRAGEPYRVARALAWEAAHVSNAGGPSRRRTARLLQAARSLAQRIEHPHALGLTTLTTGIAAYMQGRWKDAREHCQQAEKIFREQCTGVAWEIDTAQSFILWSLTFLGQVAELNRRLPELLLEARERGDLYAATNCATFVGHLTWLAADDPQGARQELQQVMQQWSQQGFHVQHLTGLMGQTQIDLYQGDGLAAWNRLGQQWSALKGSQFLRVQTVRIYMHHLRGRSALAAASGGQAGTSYHRLLRAATGDVRRIRREKMAWARPLAQLLQAGIHNASGQHPPALELLAQAVAGFEAADMPLFAAAARRRQGELLGGPPGQALIEQADAWMASQQIRNPRRMTAQHAPGFEEH